MTFDPPVKFSIPDRLKKIAACMAVIAMVATMIPAEAFAGSRGGHGGYGGHYRGGHGGYHQGGGYRGYRHHYRPRHYRGYSGGHYGHGYYGSSAWVPWAILGGAVIGYAVADNRRANTSYTQAQGYSATKPCHMAYRDENQNGELVRMAATMCYDPQGTAFLVEGSEHRVPME